MTPLWLQAAVPAALGLLAGRLSGRFAFRTLPALYSTVAVEFLLRALWIARNAHAIALPGWAGAVTAPLQLALATAGVYAVLLTSRIAVTRASKTRVALAVIAASAAFGLLPQGMLPLERIYLGRQCAYVALALIAWGAECYRLARPVPEWRHYRGYRLGMALWLSVRALAGVFVPRGLGYQVFPFGASTYAIVDALAYAAFALAVVAMTVLMTVDLPRRKRAAKSGDAWLSLRKAA